MEIQNGSTVNNADCIAEKELININSEFSTRIGKLKEFFETKYHHKPSVIIKVPGRVNIIGEHVDYCGYPVLPMALEQCILLAISTNLDGFLHLSNINEKYVNFKCDLKSFTIDLPSSGGPEWYNYFLCGIKGILESNKIIPNIGISVAVSGNVPSAAGLSSSSALVCSATLAMAYAYKISLNRTSLAAISASCERFIGTQGGGMDQAIAFLAKKGCAQFIEFYPTLNSHSIKLPQNAFFVVAHSLTEMNKAATSDFNERVVECRLVSRMLAKKYNFNNWKDISKLYLLQKTLNCDLEELETIISREIHKDIYTRNDIFDELDIDEDAFQNDLLTPNTRNMKLFKLRQRALHVVQESIRVRKFRSICDGGNANIKTLSELLKESHKSLKNLFECSHTNLDTLVELSLKMNIGARLTGAGWGGCIVALCESAEQSEKYINYLKDNYYKNLPQAKNRSLDDIIFTTTPQNGAEIFYC